MAKRKNMMDMMDMTPVCERCGKVAPVDEKMSTPNWTPQRVKTLLLRQPATDVAEVVRCKDCKYGSYDSKPNGAMVCLRTNDGFWRKEADFCSYGEYQTNTGGNDNVSD